MFLPCRDVRGAKVEDRLSDTRRRRRRGLLLLLLNNNRHPSLRIMAVPECMISTVGLNLHNLHGITADDIRRHLEIAGPIAKFTKTPQPSGRSVFVITYVARDGAARALKECQTMYTHAQDPIDLSLRGFKPRGGQPSTIKDTTNTRDFNRSVFVSQLPREATMDEVKNHFLRAGNVESVDMLPKRPGPRGGMAKVLYATHEDARRAVDELHARSFSAAHASRTERTLRVEWDKDFGRNGSEASALRAYSGAEAPRGGAAPAPPPPLSQTGGDPRKILAHAQASAVPRGSHQWPPPKPRALPVTQPPLKSGHGGLPRPSGFSVCTECHAKSTGSYDHDGTFYCKGCWGTWDAQRDVPGGFSQGSVGFAPFRGGGQSGGNSIEHRLREGVLRMLRGSAGRQLLLTKVVAELYKESDEYRAYVTKIGSAKKVFARDEWKGLVACHLPEGYAKGNEVLELLSGKNDAPNGGALERWSGRIVPAGLLAEPAAPPPPQPRQPSPGRPERRGNSRGSTPTRTRPVSGKVVRALFKDPPYAYDVSDGAGAAGAAGGSKSTGPHGIDEHEMTYCSIRMDRYAKRRPAAKSGGTHANPSR